MRSIMCGVDERDRPIPCELTQSPELGLMPLDFRPVAPPKFRPARGVMSEPFAQFGAGRDLLHPFIDFGSRLSDSPRPQAVDEDPRSIIGGGWFVGSLQPDAVSRDLSTRVFPPCVHDCAAGAAYPRSVGARRCQPRRF